MRSLKLIRAVRATLREMSDPARAAGMKAYMKSVMPYLGVSTPRRRTALKVVFATHPVATFEEWRDTVLSLWRDARFREERYAAIELAEYRRYESFRTLRALPIFEAMITSGAWWDYVDDLASNCIGGLLRKYPARMQPVLRKWSMSDDIWKRRSAIIAQLQFKTDTDIALLFDCIRPSHGRHEFFLRKAIGWALRQHARVDADAVLRYVQKHDAGLSPLTKREALKHVSAQHKSLSAPRNSK